MIMRSRNSYFFHARQKTLNEYTLRNGANKRVENVAVDSIRLRHNNDRENLGIDYALGSVKIRTPLPSEAPCQVTSTPDMQYHRRFRGKSFEF